MNPQESATDRELDQFYGTPPTEAQVQESIRRFTEAFNKYDLSEIVSEHFDALMLMLSAPYAMGEQIAIYRRRMIADWVSKELYGKTGVITAKDIK